MQSKLSRVETDLVACAKSGKRCEISDRFGRKRTVEFYMIYFSATGKRCLHMYQIEGYSESGEPTGWKNPESDTIVSVMPLVDSFEVRQEYNPLNRRMFVSVLFALPDADGTERV